MAAQGLVSVPTPHPTESFERKALPTRQRPIRYPKETHDPKVLPHTCKVQYASPKSQKVSRDPPDVDVDVDAEAEVKHHRSQAQTELEHQRPVTPPTPERQDDHEGPEFHGGLDSLDDDSSSDYINNTSDDEEDYDDGECSVYYRLGLLILLLFDQT